MYSIIISNEGVTHYTDFLRIYNIDGLIKYMNYIKIHKTQINCYSDTIRIYEINSQNIFEKKSYLYSK